MDFPVDNNKTFINNVILCESCKKLFKGQRGYKTHIKTAFYCKEASKRQEEVKMAKNQSPSPLRLPSPNLHSPNHSL